MLAQDKLVLAEHDHSCPAIPPQSKPEERSWGWDTLPHGLWGLLPAAGLGEMWISFSALWISFYTAVRTTHVASGGVSSQLRSDAGDSTECKCASATGLLPLKFSVVQLPEPKDSWQQVSPDTHVLSTWTLRVPAQGELRAAGQLGWAGDTVATAGFPSGWLSPRALMLD